MKVCVTGATGCLGNPLVGLLISRGCYARILSLPGDPAIAAFQGKAEIIYGDLSSSKAVRSLTNDCEVLFHLAARVHSTPRLKAEAEKLYEINVRGTAKVLDAAKASKVKRVVFYSTVGVYGKDADFHGDETSLCRPLSFYSKTKYEAERLILNSEKNGGPEGVVLRLPVAYGPLDRGNVVALIRAVKARKFFYFGEGGAVRSMISSRNAAEAAIKAAFGPLASNNVFCVTDSRDYTVRELIETICRSVGTSWRPRHVRLSAAQLMGIFGDVVEKLARIQCPINSDKVRKLSRPLTFSCEKAKKLLAYEPVETLTEGISREMSWLRETEG